MTRPTIPVPDHIRHQMHFIEITGHFIIRPQIERSNFRALPEQFVPSFCLHTIHGRPPAKLSLKHTVECKGKCFYSFVGCIVIDMSSAVVRKLFKGFRLPRSKHVMYRELV